MMPNVSRDQFLQNLGDSGLFRPEDLNKTSAALAEARAADGTAAAQRLVEEGKLTPYQAAAILERRFDHLVIGNYEILAKLGQGGMGTVYKARHKRMRRIVAIKVLATTAAQNERFVKRFQREVEAAARLNHPNVVMAFDADEAAAGHFLVMEFVDGRDLDSIVREKGPLSVREAIGCIVQAAWALEYAHGQGIIHRDIKPANLMRDVHGVIKVADMGLARFDEALGPPPEETSALTQAGAIMGTVDYMSPEQALGALDIDHRTDIYSLGCTLYFLLLGKPPFAGNSLMAILLKHREAPIPSLSEERADVPAELDEVFRRMLAKAAADRYQTMQEVVQALEAIEEKLRESASEPGGDFEVDSFELGSTTSVPVSSQTIAAGPTPIAAATVDILPPSGQTVDLAPPPSAPAPAVKVLLVEPSRTQAGIIRRYLQGQGVQNVTTVATGEEALVAAERDRPDVVLAALHLAGLGGVQLAEKMLALLGSTPPGFVIISSEAESAEAQSLSKCGNALLLKKPFTQEQLADALKVVAGKRAAVAPAASDLGKLRILIVDDSAPARLHVRKVLAGLGCTQMMEATDGAHAITVLATNQFDVIVTDYNMPHVDGRALVGYLKQNPQTATVPIIMVTTEDDPGKLEAVRRLGVAAVVAKNFPPQIVSPLLERVVRGS